MSPTTPTSTQNPVESDHSQDRQPEVANKGTSMSMPLQGNMSPPAQSDGVLVHPLQRPVSDAQSNERPATSDTTNQQEELTVEGGTISISSIYSQGLSNNLAQALEIAGIDLSQANISVQIDIGKRANTGLMADTSFPKANISVQIDIGKRANTRLMADTSFPKDMENPPSIIQPMAKLRDVSSGEHSTTHLNDQLRPTRKLCPSSSQPLSFFHGDRG